MNSSKKRIAVTGGSGYLGSLLVAQLRSKGHRVLNLDVNISNDIDDRLLNIQDENSVRAIFEREQFEMVFHLAAKKSIPESFQNPNLYTEVNLQGTKNIGSACLATGVRHLVFASSAAVYGDVKNSPVSESTLLTSENPYAESKIGAESYLLANNGNGSLQIDIMRIFNVVGSHKYFKPKDFGNLFFALEKAVQNDLPFALYNNSMQTPDGSCVRDYISVQQVVRFAISLLEVPSLGQNRIFNVCNGVGFSVLEVIEEFRRKYGKEIEIDTTKSRLGDLPIIVGDPMSAMKQLDFKVETRLQSILFG
jgi:UDP-glucose 4-epimerase